MAALCLLGAPGFARANDQALDDRIAGLERQTAALALALGQDSLTDVSLNSDMAGGAQGAMAGGTQDTGIGTGSGAGQGYLQVADGTPLQISQLPDNYAAEVEVRLSRLEEQVRDLNGKIEQLNYAVSQNENELQRALNDFEYRLSTLEGGGANGAPTGPSGSPTGPSSSPTGPSSSPTGPSSTGSGNTGSTGSGAASGSSSSIGPTFDALTGDRTANYGAGTLGNMTVGSATIPPDGGDTTQQFQDAFALLQRADYSGAEQSLQAFLQAHSDDPLASNAQYWLGETYYVQGRYNDAAIAFAQGYQRYPDGDKAVDSLLKLGMSLSALGQTEDACLTFEQLHEVFPNAPAAIVRRAQQESARLGCS